MILISTDRGARGAGIALICLASVAVAPAFGQMAAPDRAFGQAAAGRGFGDTLAPGKAAKAKPAADKKSAASILAAKKAAKALAAKKEAAAKKLAARAKAVKAKAAQTARARADKTAPAVRETAQAAVASVAAAPVVAAPVSTGAKAAQAAAAPAPVKPAVASVPAASPDPMYMYAALAAGLLALLAAAAAFLGLRRKPAGKTKAAEPTPMYFQPEAQTPPPAAEAVTFFAESAPPAPIEAAIAESARVQVAIVDAPLAAKAPPRRRKTVAKPALAEAAPPAKAPAKRRKAAAAPANDDATVTAKAPVRRPKRAGSIPAE
jgi:hypothetical protein